MNNGVLQFTLGLEASNFLRELGISSRAVAGVAAIAEGVRMAANKMWGAIDQGAALEGLAARTDQSVQSLYRMEEGFKAVGLGADAVPGVIMRMQRSLSGVNEMGQKTNHIFAALGLNMAQLRDSSAETQINAIARALAKLGTSNATGVASQLFGRGASGDMLQIARAKQEYDRVMTATKGDSLVFGAMAKAWQEIKGDVEIFDSHIHATWAAIASGITPELQKVLKQINELTAMWGPGIAGAFQFGDIKELLEDALMAGFEQGGYYGKKILEGLAVGFGDLIYAALKIAFEDVLPILWNGIKNAYALGASLSMQKSKENNIKLYGEREADALQDNDPKMGAHWHDLATQAQVDVESQKGFRQKTIEEGAGDFAAHIADAMKTGAEAIEKGIEDGMKSYGKDDPNRPHAAADRLNALIAKDSAKWTKLHPEPPPKKNPPPISTENHYRPEFTSFEKMGFVMGGLPNPMARTEDLLKQIRDVLKSESGTGPAPAQLLTNAV